jgi:two-component system, NtrC family, response regulator GlrR
VRRSNVRVMASTNVDLSQYAQQELFREDLYFRLAVLTLLIPPLRSRREDISVLAEHFVAHYSAFYGKSVTLSSGVLDQLSQYSWPGNVRELQNLVHRAVVHAAGPVIDRIEFASQTSVPALRDVTRSGSSTFSAAKKELVDQFEREYIVRLLEECNGNVSKAARRAGKNRRAFWEIMRKHNIHRLPD